MLCCVVRTAFSTGERSDQRTWPVSPVKVMDLRCGWGGGVGVEVCVACTWWVVEKVVRPRCDRLLATGWMRGRRKVGRKRAIASLGLYMAVMFSEA